jgi:sodium/hydrogen exchanger 8
MGFNITELELLSAADEAAEAAVEAAEEAADEAQHIDDGWGLVLLCYSLVALVLIGIWAERKHVPSSLAAVAVGVFLGLVLRMVGAESAPALHSLLFFDEEIFLYALLPPIIFEAGFSISRGFFFNNLATILLFAVVGTILTTFVVGQACQLAGSSGWFRSGSHDALDFRVPRDSYTFGALISATDPVATLSIMGAYRVDPLMYTLVAGESVLNDAVAIVLVRILQSLGPGAFQHPAAFLVGVLQFFAVSLGSLAVAVAVAAPSALLLKRLDLSGEASFELSLVLLLGYCAFPTAEALHCSGILSLFVCSVLMGHYHVRNLSVQGRAVIELALKSLSHLSETFVFMYMGLDLVAQEGAVDDLIDADMGEAGVDEAGSTRLFVAFAVLVVPLARVVVVPPLVLIANRFRGRKRSLSGRETIFLIFAGLRGAIAYALARSSASAHRRTIVAATTAVVLFTTYVLGGTTRLMLNVLGMISKGEDPSESDRARALGDGDDDDDDDADDIGGGGGGGGGGIGGGGGGGGGKRDAQQLRSDGGGLAQRFFRYDARVLQPIFGKSLERPEGGDRTSGVELEPLSGASDSPTEAEQ